MATAFKYDQNDMREDFAYNYRRLRSASTEMQDEIFTAYIELLRTLNAEFQDGFEQLRNERLISLLEFERQIPVVQKENGFAN